MSDSGRYFVDTFSKVNTAPKSVLFDAAGTNVMPLETVDLSAAMQAGYKFPEPFKVKADDGITDLYGVMYKPFDFDPAKKYPIIEYVYPGPQKESVTKTFTGEQPDVHGELRLHHDRDRQSRRQSAPLEVVSHLRLRQPARLRPGRQEGGHRTTGARYPFIDIDRVGMWGHSGGGFMTAAAMLIYPDFFKVGWSESGNHENNIYNNTWSEKHHGVKEVTDKDGKVTFEYTIDKNSEIAKNLKGHLMLITGDIDNNVHPSNTYRLADALIKANKRFDMMVLPGQRHGYTTAGEYVTWLRADYFAKHLLGDYDQSIDMWEINREKQAADKTPAAGAVTGGRGGTQVQQTGGRGRGGR